MIVIVAAVEQTTPQLQTTNISETATANIFLPPMKAENSLKVDYCEQKLHPTWLTTGVGEICYDQGVAKDKQKRK